MLTNERGRMMQEKKLNMCQFAISSSISRLFPFKYKQIQLSFQQPDSESSIQNVLAK